ncbi:hypothetical protein tloyanaT_32650 [Thalassotalea loyana]|uniref:Uncharacterized protein n=2 Tax=Thalassotalea loyana TaxID=280483 RepID=A0ABQ6HFZ2_9GAMM|nr:hypothetical protein tloyanaT_32650 [Thalassotalea loyana]
MKQNGQDLSKCLQQSNTILKCFDIEFYSYWIQLINVISRSAKNCTNKSNEPLNLEKLIIGLSKHPNSSLYVQDISDICSWSEDDLLLYFNDYESVACLYWKVECSINNDAYYFDEYFVACPSGKIYQILMEEDL